MGWPVTFGTAVSPEALSNLDLMFNQAAAQMSIPCSAVGANTISLTPLTNNPALSSYNELGGYRFVAAANSTAAVTLQYNGLSVLPVYHADGLTQANIGDLIAGEQYIATFHQSLNGGGGGFYLESPSIPNASSNWYSPGGRLSLVQTAPVMFSTQTAIQSIFYPCYTHQFVPNFNGSIVQMLPFSTPLSNTTGPQINMNGASNFPIGVYDCFITFTGASPNLVMVAWTNTTTRATTLSVFGGFLTNSGSMTAQTGPNTSVTVPINQGTFVGSVYLNAQGQTQWGVGGSASGGNAPTLYVSNYYNTVLFTFSSVDSGASYTYSSSTVRQARASVGNAISWVSTSSERAALVSYFGSVTTVNAAIGAQTSWGLGINSTTTFVNGGFTTFQEQAGGTFNARLTPSTQFSITGLVTVSGNEQGDGTNANTLNSNSSNTISGSIWL